MATHLSLKAGLIITIFSLISCQASEPSPPPASGPDIQIESEDESPPPETPSPTPTPLKVQSVSHTPSATTSKPPSPTAAPTQEPCWQEGGRVNRHTLETDLDPRPWEFRVYTPPCYDQHSSRYYPLIILIHGSTYTDSQWDDLGADEAADALIGSGRTPPFLILMPRDRVWVEPKDDPFGDAVVTHILPWVDNHYRTIPDRAYRAIGGLSRGASWAVHLGLKYWWNFSAIGAHSLPVFVTDPPRIQGWLEDIPDAMLPRIYIDIGENDYLLDKASWFEAKLTELNIPHEWYLNVGRHESGYWEAHVQEYLIWYADGW